MDRHESEVRPKHYKLRLLSVQVIPGIDNEHVQPVIGDAQCEVIDVIEALGFQDDAYLTTAMIYLMRLRQKGSPVVDVKKARWWLDRWLQAQEQASSPSTAGGAP